MNGTEKDDIGIPSFLKREPKQAPKEETSEAPMSNVATEAGKPSRKPPVKAADKPKPAKASKAPKAAKAAPAKAAKASRPRQAGGKYDAYGFREGTLKSKAAAIYAAKKGATVDEIKAELGSTQLNLITELEKAGHNIKREKVNGKGNRDVTRYWIIQ